ncbi:MAG TPA: D-glycero-beta-D-manno-heptose-7-phosphate kinase [Alphaproteobacteria bacterium]|nr:D-glycero-beta-D-manno-heptose-7-phosphate kinase [Alphaproteobacteria bacterium]
MNNFNNLSKEFKNSPVLLIGDIMLDNFVYGSVSRISPEGPIPVLSVLREDTMLGGAGNVFANLNALGCPVQLVAVIGQDAAGRNIIDRIEDMGASGEGLIIDETRPTILKTRYLGQNQQLLRVDREQTSVIAKNIQDKILEHAEKIIGKTKLMILSDYGKGVLSPDLIKKLIHLAKKKKIPVIVDPKGTDFSIYKGASVITPNKKELSAATNNMPVDSDDNIELAAQVLMKQSGVENVVATRSEDGMSVVPKKGTVKHLKTKVQEVYDVSGAGDTVVAVLAACLAAGASLVDAAQFANIAGGLAVAKVGTAIIRHDEILSAIENDDNNLSQGRIARIADWDSAKELIRKWQKQGLKVGFTNGCFDIVHYGHVNYLNQARDKCDRLVLGLNHDQSVKILKGENRPINDQMARATVIGALGSVDLVVFFGAEEEGQDNTPCDLVAALKPDILMKGGDYTVDQLPEAKVVLSYGGAVDIMPLYEGYSTTNIIRKSKSEAA